MLYNRILRRGVGCSFRSLRSPNFTGLASVSSKYISSCVIDSVSNQLALNKAKLSHPVMIICGADERSVQLKQQMWVELQQIGVQSVSATVLGQYSTPETLQELGLMTRRSSAKSIIAIGDSSVMQAAATCRQWLLLGSKEFSTEKEWEQTPVMGTGPLLPLMLVPTGLPTAVPYSNHSVMLSAESGNVMSTLLTTPAEMVIHDKNLSDPFTASDLKASYVSVLGELLDTVHAAVFAGTVHTGEMRKVARRPSQQQQQQAPWSRSTPEAVLREEDDWEKGMHDILCAEINKLDLRQYAAVDIDSASAYDVWTHLWRLSHAVAQLRAALTVRFFPLETPLNWATPVQMRTAYELLRLHAVAKDSNFVSSKNLLKLLVFVSGERDRLINKRSGCKELIPHYALLRSISHMLSIVNGKEGDAIYKGKGEDLLKDDALYTGIDDLRTRVQSLLGDGTPDDRRSSTDFDVDVSSFDELRLAEEINMEDQVYSHDQIRRAVAAKGIQNANPKDGDETAVFARLNYVKCDLFNDYCNEDDA